MGKRSRRQSQFWSSALSNQQVIAYYTKRILNLALSRFEWYGDLPDTVDTRFLELGLLQNGMGIWYKDDVLGELSLWCTVNGEFNQYGIPIHRRAWGYNGFQSEDLNDSNSVLIYNDMSHSTDCNEILMFAERLYLCQRVADINLTAQKTPVLLECPEEMKLTLMNLFEAYDGNQPFIYGNKKINLEEMVRVLKTDAPYLADKIREEKVEIWNELMTWLGIASLSIDKGERMIRDEVQKSMGSSFSSRFSYEFERQQAAKKIENMFGHETKVRFRQDMYEQEAMSFHNDLIGGRENGQLHD